MRESHSRFWGICLSVCVPFYEYLNDHQMMNLGISPVVALLWILPLSRQAGNKIFAEHTFYTLDPVRCKQLVGLEITFYFPTMLAVCVGLAPMWHSILSSSAPAPLCSNFLILLSKSHSETKGAELMLKSQCTTTHHHPPITFQSS